jgi:phage-related minor tail protein
VSLASLTIDLTANLSRFEGDMGKAGQIATRTGDALARAAAAAEKALAKQADQVGRTQTEYLALQAAQAGLGDSAKRFLDIIEKSGTATAAASAKTAFSLQSASTAAESAADRQRTSNAELVKSILLVNDAYVEQRRIQLAARQAGTIGDDTLKSRLNELNTKRDSAIAQLKQASAQQAADREVEANAQASIERRKAAMASLLETVQKLSFQATQAQIAEQQKAETAARKLIDTQNGLTATYREQLRALRDLRDAGAISPAQFRQAGTELVSRQPVVKENAATKQAAEDAAKAEAARALALAQSASATSFAAAQAQVYLAVLIAQTAAANQAAAAETRLKEITEAQAAYAERQRAAQQAAYDTKTAYIAKVNEEAAALFRTRDAQRQLDAERAGVGSAQAAQLAKRTGDREFIQTIYQAIAAEERFAETFGKTATEILKQDAATKNLSNTTASAIARFDALATANQKARDAAKTAQANEQYLSGIEREVTLLGKARSETIALELARRGLSGERADRVVKAFQDIDARTGQLGKSAFASRNQLLTLQYTISDVIASAGSGISPLTILLQQGGQVFDAFGGAAAQGKGGFFRNFITAIAQIITPARLAIGGVTGAVGAFAYAMYQGAQQSKEFNDAIVLTGNYAGQTAGQFTEATKRISASGQVSVSAAREFGQALLATGQVGPKVFEKATEAAARYGQATGKNAKDVAADFASMGEDVYKWATEHNKQLNLVSVAQLEHVRKLQEQGKAAEAQTILYDALIKRLAGLEPNLGLLDRALRATKNAWAEFWDAAFDIGREKTIEQKIAEAVAAAKLARSGATAPFTQEQLDAQRARGVGTERVSQTQLDPQRRAQLAQSGTAYASDKDEVVADLLKEKLAKDQNAAATASLLALNKEVGADTTVVDSVLRQAKAYAGLTREIDAMKARFARQDQLAERDPAFKETAAFTSKADRALILAKIKENYTDKPAISEANQTRKAQLAKDLKDLQDQFAKEKQVLQFGQAELSALYNAGAISLEQYYDRKRENIQTGVDKELTVLAKERTRLEAELKTGNFKAPADRIDAEKKLAEVIVEADKVTRESRQATRLANTEEGESFRQLGQQVNEFRASILQLSGDEAAAARLRAQTAIQNARREQTRAGSQITDEDVAAYGILTVKALEFADAQRKVGEVTARASTAEQAFLLRSTQAGDTLEEQERGIYLIRSAQLSQLGELRDKVQQLAADSTDPKILQYAADLALQYQQAAENIDPALSRIRDAGKEMADSLAANLSSVVVKFTSLKDLGKSVLETLQSTVQKLVQAPIQAAFEGAVRKGLNTALGTDGVGKGSAEAAKAAETAAVTTNTSTVVVATGAMVTLTTTAQAAAAALASVAASATGGSAKDIFALLGGGYTQGGGSGITGGVDFSGIGFPLADGTNFVPYDGMRAILHKGEGVTPAKYNPAAGGSAGRPQVVNIHPPPNTESSTQQNDDGSVDVFMRQTEKFIAGRVANGRSPVNTGLKSRGVNTSAGLAKRG